MELLPFVYIFLAVAAEINYAAAGELLAILIVSLYLVIIW